MNRCVRAGACGCVRVRRAFANRNKRRYERELKREVDKQIFWFVFLCCCVLFTLLCIVVIIFFCFFDNNNKIIKLALASRTLEHLPMSISLQANELNCVTRLSALGYLKRRSTFMNVTTMRVPNRSLSSPPAPIRSLSSSVSVSIENVSSPVYQ